MLAAVPDVGETTGVHAGADAGSRASHWASSHNAEAAGAAGGGGMSDDGDGGAAAAVLTGAGEAARAAAAAAGGAVMGPSQGVFDSGRTHTCYGNCNLSATDPGCSYSNTDFRP